MDRPSIRCYFGSHRVLSVEDGWYRPSREPNGEPLLILRLFLRNGRRVIVRANQIAGSMELWYAFVNGRRVFYESESSSAASSHPDDDSDGAANDTSGVHEADEETETTDESEGNTKTKVLKMKKTIDGSQVSVVLKRCDRSKPKKKISKDKKKTKDGKVVPKPKPLSSSSSSSSTNSLFDSSPPATPGSSPKKPKVMPYVCSYTGCNHGCLTASGLTNHFNTMHEKGRKVTCPFCSKEFSYSNLSAHKKRCPKNPSNEKQAE